MSWINECKEKCKKIKYVNEKFLWETKPSRSDFLVASSMLEDENKEIIPKLYLKGEYRLLTKGRGEVYSVSLQYLLRPRELRRVLMIEAYPCYFRSHRDSNGDIFGPHIHLGDDRLEQVVKQLRASRDGLPFSHWAGRFVRHARTHYPEQQPLPGPFTPTAPNTDDMFN